MRELTNLMARIGRDQAAGRMDLEAWETALRAAVLKFGATCLESLLKAVGVGRRREAVICKWCGEKMQSEGVREKTVLTILGSVCFGRSLFRCPKCGATHFPGDELLGIEQSAFSSGLRRMMARAGSQSCFAQAEEDLRLYVGVQVDSKSVERVCKQVGEKVQQWAAKEREEVLRQAQHSSPGSEQETIPILYVEFDATGVPARREELEGRKGKQPDGKSKTRQAKLGCVFTQTGLDQKGRPVRDPMSTTYVGKIESSEDFGLRIYAETLTQLPQRVVKYFFSWCARGVLGVERAGLGG